MRLFHPAVAVAATLGLLGYQSYIAFLPAAPGAHVPASTNIDLEHLRMLGQTLKVAPLDLESTPAAATTPLERTDILAPAQERPAKAVRPAARKAPSSAASKPSPSAPARAVARPAARAAAPKARPSSFTAALSRSNFTRIDFGFQGVQRDTTRGKAVRSVRR